MQWLSGPERGETEFRGPKELAQTVQGPPAVIILERSSVVCYARINQTAYTVANFQYCCGIVSITQLYSNQMTGPQIECKGPPIEWYGLRRPYRVPEPPNLHFNHWFNVKLLCHGLLSCTAALYLHVIFS